MPHNLTRLNSAKQILNLSPRITGGKESDIKRFPYAAFLGVYYSDDTNSYISDVSYCGAVIIGDEWILTAAHCFGYNKYLNIKQ